MQNQTTNQSRDSHQSMSVLASLRSLQPKRRLSFSESLRIAELQAGRLRSLSGLSGVAAPTEMITDLPRIDVVRDVDLPVSGSTHWNGAAWIITINGTESWTRQRLTLFHEYKHIIDHGQRENLYSGSRTTDAAKQAEQAADYFAGCVLVPKRELKTAWCSGIQRLSDLASHFGVSTPAIKVRLAQVGLSEPNRRCSVSTRPVRPSRTHYFRTASLPANRPGVLHEQHA